MDGVWLKQKVSKWKKGKNAKHVEKSKNRKKQKEASSNKLKGLTTVDAEEIPCEFSVEDDFEIDETAEGVDGKIDKTIWAGKKKEPDAMGAFGIFDVCEELPKDAKIITTRWENVPKGDNWRCRLVAREFRHDDQDMEGLHTSGFGHKRPQRHGPGSCSEGRAGCAFVSLSLSVSVSLSLSFSSSGNTHHHYTNQQ